MKKTILFASAIAAAVATSGAIAAPADDSGPYVALGVGQSHFSVDGTAGKKTDTGSMFSVGYNFNRNVALELGYSDYGKVNLLGGGNAKANSGQISAILTAPVGDGFSVYGRLGAASTRRDANTGSIFAQGSRKTEAIYGVGGAYAFNKNVAATLEWNKLGSTDVSAWLVGVRLSF